MTTRTTLAPLTSLRFFAALLVLAHHAGVFPPGYAGVTFFFILSGFILAFNYLDRLEHRGDLIAFARRRFARIYPSHFLTFILAIPLATMAAAQDGVGQIDNGKALANLLLMQSWFPDLAVYFSANAVSWSISNEAFFYALFPWLLAFFAARSARAGGTVVALWLAVLAALATVWWLLRADSSDADPLTHYLFYINPATRLGEFALGVWSGVRFARVRRTGTTAPLVLVWEAALVPFFAAPFALMWLYDVPHPFATSLLFVPASLAAIEIFARSQGPLARLLGHPVLLLLGKASFMLYMIHQLTIRYAVALLGDARWVPIAAALAAVPLAIVLHLIYEEPLERRISRRTPREAAATAP